VTLENPPASGSRWRNFLVGTRANFSPRTVTTARGYIDTAIVPGLGSMAVTELTPADLGHFCRQLMKHRRSSQSVLTRDDQKGARDDQAGGDPQNRVRRRIRAGEDLVDVLVKQGDLSISCLDQIAQALDMQPISAYSDRCSLPRVLPLLDPAQHRQQLVPPSFQAVRPDTSAAGELGERSRSPGCDTGQLGIVQHNVRGYRRPLRCL
jgi:hypothetical protein